MNQEDNLRLSPPWHTYFNFIKETIGHDPCVEVLDMKEVLSNQFLIQIQVQSNVKARALATILELHKNFGNINIDIEIIHCGCPVCPYEDITDIDDLLKLFRLALDTNCYFEFVRAVKIMVFNAIFPVFKKAVIQFFNDDLSDFYHNFNGVAADVFREVLKHQINGIYINPSTSKC